MISMDKKYRTRDGRDVRILCVDGPDDAPVVGLIGRTTASWHLDGRWAHAFTETAYDLVEHQEPDVRTIWVNVYEGFCRSFNSERSARESGLSSLHGSALSIAQPVTFKVERRWKG